jgi:hypothetical protein
VLSSHTGQCPGCCTASCLGPRIRASLQVSQSLIAGGCYCYLQHHIHKGTTWSDRRDTSTALVYEQSPQLDICRVSTIKYLSPIVWSGPSALLPGARGHNQAGPATTHGCPRALLRTSALKKQRVAVWSVRASGGCDPSAKQRACAATGDAAPVRSQRAQQRRGPPAQRTTTTAAARRQALRDGRGSCAVCLWSWARRALVEAGSGTHPWRITPAASSSHGQHD